MATFLYPAVSVTSLPPLGGATSANQLLEIAELQDINANTAGPVKIRKNGTVQEVNKDTGTPANTVAIPVEIVSASGTTINITAGDINIQTTSEGSNFDSMRIGSGSGFFAEVTSNNDLSTFDSLSFTELVEINQQTMNIDLKTPSLGQALEAASVPVVLPALQIAALTPPAAITGFALETTQLDVKTAVEAINTKTPALGQALNAASVPVVLTAAQIATLTPPAAITGFATSARQDLQTASLISIDGKLASPLTTTQAVPSVTGTDESNASINNTTGHTFTKPAGAKNMVIFNNGADVSAFPGTNANRVRIGQAPDWSSGVGAILGVGGSTALLPATTFTAVAETSTVANVTVLWFY